MIVQGLGAEVLARLLRLDRPGDEDAWLLFGPTDAIAVQGEDGTEPAPQPLRWAAE